MKDHNDMYNDCSSGGFKAFSRVEVTSYLLMQSSNMQCVGIRKHRRGITLETVEGI